MKQYFKLSSKILSINLAILIFFQGFGFAAYKVAEDEIKSSDSVDFENYQGERPVYVDQPETVQGIGSYLAGDPDTQEANYNGKYSVLKIRDAEDGTNNLFSADIVSILPDARVNTIRNIRRIITGYLQSSYNYNYQDATLLAVFVTYYNALLRTDKSSFQARYSQKVLKVLVPEKTGLGRTYQEWAGNSQIIIPVMDDSLGGGIDAFEIGNEDVNNALRKEDGKGIPEREAIVNAQKEQLQQENQALADSKQQNINAQAQLAQENDQLQKDLQNATTPLEKAAVEEAIKANETRQAAIKKEAEDLSQQETVAQEQEKQLVQNQNTLEQDKKEVAQPANNNNQAQPANNNNQAQPANNNNQAQPANNNNQAQPANNNNQATQMTPEQKVETLEQKVQEQQVQLTRNEKIEGDYFYYLEKVSYFNGKNKDSVLIMVDPIAKKIKTRSPLKTISGNRFDIFDKGIIVIARENPKSEINHLTMLDKQTLEILKVGKEDIYSEGMLRVDGQKIYAIFKKEAEFFLGQFNPELELVNTSSIPVDKDTFLSFYQGKVYLADSSGSMVILNDSDLTLDTDGRVSE